MNIGGIEVGGNNPCRFVAEISNNHNGDFDRAIRLIDAAKEAGADFVKFQCYTADELVALRGDGPAPEPWGSQGWTMRALYENAATPLEWFPRIFQHARDVGIVPFSSVFGPTSLEVLRSVKCPAFKIARLDCYVYSLAVSIPTDTPLIVSADDINRITAGAGPQAILYCPPDYPTAPRDVRLPGFGGPDWRVGSHTYLGLSSHCLASELPIAAVARGCKLIEMHMMLEAEPSELEANVSLTEVQFAAMVKAVRRTEEMLS